MTRTFAIQKTLMSIALGAAVAAPSAYADVTLSGSINMGIAWADSDDGQSGNNSIVGTHGTGGGVDQFSVTRNYSNVTISSTDDLGGGMKLDFAFQVVADTNVNNAIANRNSHLGLVSEHWGGVWYGTNENIYERYLYSIDPLDGAAGIGGNLQMLGTPGYGVVFDAPNGRAATVAGQAGFYRRTEHTLWYDSPNFGGLTFGLAWFMPAYKSDTGPLSNPTGYSAGVKWAAQNMPLQLWAAYENHDDYNGISVIASRNPFNTTPNDTDDHAIQAGASFTLGDILLFGIYEKLEYNADGLSAGAVSNYERDAFSVGVKWNLASGYVGVQYIQALEASCEVVGAGCDDNGTGGKMIGAAYYHTMSKQTQAYIMGTWIDNDENQNFSLAGAATPNPFSGANAGVNSGLGTTHIAVTVGLKHSF